VNKLFSTTELARIWNVSESTVKRWADTGDLVCVKTRGGHRRFTLDEIVRFQRLQGFDASGTLTATDDDDPSLGPTDLERALERPNLEALASLLADHALDGDADRVATVMTRAYLRGVSPVDICDLIVTPALHTIGDRWLRGELTVAAEHLASRTIADALTRLQHELIRRPSIDRTAVIGCPEAELHEIASRCIAMLLELEGWRVIALGMNTPFFSYRDAIEAHHPQLVCISSTVLMDVERQARDYAGLPEVARAAGVRLAIGGAGFREPAVRARFAHDVYCESFRQLLQFAAAS
jgi:excisionase family DNA binding protein